MIDSWAKDLVKVAEELNGGASDSTALPLQEGMIRRNSMILSPHLAELHSSKRVDVRHAALKGTAGRQQWSAYAKVRHAAL